MFHRTHKTIAVLALGMACFAAPCVSHAAIPVKLSGSISGTVTNGTGAPQMGAAVLLYNRQDRVSGRTLTDGQGQFGFSGLSPDTYAVRVTLASFIPALKKDILVQPGMRSVLAVNLNTLFSSIQIKYPLLENGSLMSDDWKWVLRGNAATRPVMRVLESAKAPGEGSEKVFSETRGVVRVLAGDAPATGTASEADLGAAFALATSVYGNNQLEVSGNLGLGTTGTPATAFRTGYRRSEGGPEISVTMRQLYLPGRQGVGSGSDPVTTMLRSTSASLDDRSEITENLVVQYGISMDSVTFIEHVSYLSPYVRMSYSFGSAGELAFAYASGNARPDLSGDAPRDSGLQRNLNSLGMFPRVSVRGGRPMVQHGEEYELTYSRVAGSRRYDLAAYNEAVHNAALTMVAPDGLFDGAEVLSDLTSGNWIFNAGNYSSAGFTAAVTQSLGESVSATLMYGSMGALTASSRELVSANPDELRAMIKAGRKRAATARVALTAPVSGTQMIASYQWSDHRWAMPGHLYTTQGLRPMPGFNIYLRQPIPLISARQCRVEMTVDMRNLLAQGYLPLEASGGQPVVLVDNPRSLRGGVNFIF